MVSVWLPSVPCGISSHEAEIQISSWASEWQLVRSPCFREGYEETNQFHSCARYVYSKSKDLRLTVVNNLTDTKLLLEAVRDDDSPEVRSASARRIGMLGTSSDAQALASILNGEQHPEVVVAICQALGQLRYSPAVPILRVISEVYPTVREILKQFEGTHVDLQQSVRALLGSNLGVILLSAQHNQAVQEALISLEDVDVTTPLRKYICDATRLIETRRTAVDLLAQLGSPQCAEALEQAALTLLQSEDTNPPTVELLTLICKQIIRLKSYRRVASLLSDLFSDLSPKFESKRSKIKNKESKLLAAQAGLIAGLESTNDIDTLLFFHSIYSVKSSIWEATKIKNCAQSRLVELAKNNESSLRAHLKQLTKRRPRDSETDQMIRALKEILSTHAPSPDGVATACACLLLVLIFSLIVFAVVFIYKKLAA